jgi:hypothetical protein
LGAPPAAPPLVTTAARDGSVPIGKKIAPEEKSDSWRDLLAGIAVANGVNVDRKEIDAAVAVRNNPLKKVRPPRTRFSPR